MLSIEKVCVYKPSSCYQLSIDHSRYGFNAIEMRVLKTLYGLNTIPVEQTKPIVDFVKAPIESLLMEHDIDANNIRVLIHSHTSPVISSFDHSVVNEVKAQLKLTNALCFGMTLHNCASVLMALDVIDKLLRGFDTLSKAILVCGEKAFTRTTQVIPNTSIAGDACACALLSLHHTHSRLLATDHLTDGRFSRGIWMNEDESACFQRCYYENVQIVIYNAIKKAGISLSDIKLILPHNINTFSWHRIASSMQISNDRIFLKNIEEYGHCFGADVLINYATALSHGFFIPGDYFMMVTVGLGASFIAAVFQY